MSVEFQFSSTRPHEPAVLMDRPVVVMRDCSYGGHEYSYRGIVCHWYGYDDKHGQQVKQAYFCKWCLHVEVRLEPLFSSS